MRTKIALLIGLFIGCAIGPVIVRAQPFPTSTVLAINQVLTGVNPFTTGRIVASGYLNWGATTGIAGYGVRDNAGVIESKNSGGSWLPLPTSSTLPTAAPFITKILDGNLSNEFALGSLATALLLNTTTTGVPTAYAGTTCTNQFVRSLSGVGAATCATAVLSTDTSGTLSVARGGTGLTAGTSGGILAYTATGTLASSAAMPANQIVLGGGAGVVPGVLGSLGTTTTLLHGNAAGAPTFGAAVLTADVSGILPTANGGTENAFFTVAGPATSAKTFTFPNASTTILTTNAAVTAAQGGTGLATYVIGDLIQASGTTALARLAATSTGNALIAGGVGVASSWGKIGLGTHVSGTLGATNGGTGLSAFTTGDLIYASSGTTLALRAAVATGKYLRGAGVGVAPVWSTLILPNAATTGDVLIATATDTIGSVVASATGKYLRAAGAATAPVWSTLILPNAATTGDVLIATATDTVGSVAASTVGKYLRAAGAATAPAWSTLILPNAATTGDILHATGADTVGNLAAVAVGQVLISNGVAAVPVYSANPRIATLLLGADLALSGAAPTVAAGCGTTPSITGISAAFRLNVGTGGTATDCTLGLPTATTGWNCRTENLTATLANRADQRTVQVSSSTTQAVIENQTVSTGAAVAFTASDVIAVSCTAVGA